MNKQVYELSKNEVIELLEIELLRVQKNLKYKEIKKVSLLLSMVESAEFTTLKVEGVKGNNESRIMLNAGSLVECLVKSHFKSYEYLYKTFNDKESDYRNGFLNVEIKASLPNARNTPLKEEKTVILINSKGAYLIKKVASLNVPLDSQGRYFENQDYSEFENVRKIKTLSKSLGLL
jgi:hypothetical protein